MVAAATALLNAALANIERRRRGSWCKRRTEQTPADNLRWAVVAMRVIERGSRVELSGSILPDHPSSVSDGVGCWAEMVQHIRLALVQVEDERTNGFRCHGSPTVRMCVVDRSGGNIYKIMAEYNAKRP